MVNRAQRHYGWEDSRNRSPRDTSPSWCSHMPRGERSEASTQIPFWNLLAHNEKRADEHFDPSKHEEQPCWVPSPNVSFVILSYFQDFQIKGTYFTNLSINWFRYLLTYLLTYSLRAIFNLRSIGTSVFACIQLQVPMFIFLGSPKKLLACFSHLWGYEIFTERVFQ